MTHMQWIILFIIMFIIDNLFYDSLWYNLVRYGVYCLELYPTFARITEVGVASVVGRIARMLCPLVVVGLVLGCHYIATTSLFEVVLFHVGISVVYFRIETKGRGLENVIIAYSQVLNENSDLHRHY